jgi:hypothetical protein
MNYLGQTHIGFHCGCNVNARQNAVDMKVSDVGRTSLIQQSGDETCFVSLLWILPLVRKVSIELVRMRQRFRRLASCHQNHVSAFCGHGFGR